jgi:preprotein translocase subunit SecA
MSTSAWKRRLHEWRGGSVESNLSFYETLLRDVNLQRAKLTSASDQTLQSRAIELRAQAQSGTQISDLLIETFAIAAEAA